MSYQSLKGMLIWDASLVKEREDIFAAVQRLVEVAQSLIDSAVKTKDYTMPDLGYVRFFIITTSGSYLIECPLDEIEGENDRVQEMFRWFGYIRRYAEDEIIQANSETSTS
jgi:hypothetical protein